MDGPHYHEESIRLLADPIGQSPFVVSAQEQLLSFIQISAMKAGKVETFRQPIRSGTLQAVHAAFVAIEREVVAWLSS
jgi:hypothetical protein